MKNKLFKSLALASTTLFVSSFAMNSYAKITTLKIWSFSDELRTNGAIDAYEKAHPNVKVKFIVFPEESYLAKLKPALRNKRQAPDIFMAEAKIIKELSRTKYWLKLDKPLNSPALKDDYVPYAWKLGQDNNGNLRAMTWQATPGGFFYRRSYAKKFLGSDDPKVVAKAISTWDNFLSTAKMIKAKSHGKIKITGGGADLFTVYKASRKHGYVVDGKFSIPETIINWLDMYKTVYTKNLTMKSKLFTPGWYSGMKEGAFGYFLPTWGLHYLLATNAPKTSGDWAVTTPTQSFFWGGSWIGIYYKTAHKKEALDFLKMQTVDKARMTSWAKKTGDFVSRISVQQDSKDLKNKFLGGQKNYEFYMKEAKKIKGTGYTRYDLAIDAFILEEGSQYANGHQTKAQTIKNIQEKVRNAYQLDSK